ncbi:heavy metal translocating P-type ATPase metal-binding domain-containing protein [Methylomagnum ishizawai]|nr:heavy metal translocating P-type ATPase metal-binding domain-containing protein [Methylomagnum ishizawai]BBL76857.1 hypothetical protein MishRS11D_39550 [Methylomagnum ishizawai]
MSDTPYACDLCQLPVETQGYEVFTVQGRKRFCCEGCLGIYRMLHESEIVDEPPAAPAA